MNIRSLSVQWCILFAIMIFALFLRLHRIDDLMVFRSDQAIDAQAVIDITRGDITLLGPKASVGNFYNGPAVYYLMLPFFLVFGPHPLSGTLFQVAFSVLTIPLIYLLGKRLKNDIVGLVASILFAISPLHVDYARAIFNAYPAVFFSTLAIWLLVELGLMAKMRYTSRKSETSEKQPYVSIGLSRSTRSIPLVTFITGVIMGMTFQMHYFTVVLLVTAFVYPWFQRKLFSWHYFLPLAGGMVAGLSPYLLFEIKYDFLNTQGILDYVLSSSGGSSNWRPEHFIMIWPQLFAAMFFGNILWLGIGGVLFTAVILIERSHKGLGLTSDNEATRVMLILLLITTALVTAFGKPLMTHYVISIHTVLILFFSLALYETARFTDTINKNTMRSLALTTCVVGMFVVNIPSYYLFLPTNPLQDGLSAKDLQTSARIIAEDTDKSFNVGMDTQQDNRAMPIRFFLNVQGKNPLPVENYSQAETLYFLFKEATDPKKVTIWEYTSFGGSHIEKTWVINSEYRLYKIVKQNAGSGLSSP